MRHAFVLRGLVLTLLAASTCVFAGCEEKTAARMVVRPKGPITFTTTGKKETVELAFFDADGRPFVRKPDASFASLDPSVADVTTAPDGTRAFITPKASGETDVTVSAFGLEDKIHVVVSLVGSVELDPATPTKLKVTKTHTLKFTVKDDRGNVLPDAKPNFAASDYCVGVTPDGVVTGQAVGSCQVTIDVAGKRVRHTFEVE